MEVLDCSAAPVRAGRGPIPRAASKAVDLWPCSEGPGAEADEASPLLPPGRAEPDEASSCETNKASDGVAAVRVDSGVLLAALRVAPVSIRVRRAWRTSSLAVASWRMAGPSAVESEARMDAGALAR